MKQKDIKILYVEDEKGIRENLSRFLKRLTSKLFLAENGEEGLTVYKQYRPDIVLSDIRMPKMNGIDMCKEIKEINPKQHIVFITAYGESQYFTQAIEMQVDGYILKPVELNLLEDKINSIIEVIEIEESLKEKTAFIEEITKNYDNNMFLLLDKDKNILFTNQKFLNFFATKTNLVQYTDLTNHVHLTNLFQKYGNFFFPEKIENWLEEIRTIDKEQRVVKMLTMDKNKKEVFSVDIKKVEPEYTLITFTLLKK